MKYRISFVLIFIAVIAFAQDQQPANLSALRVEGNSFVNEAGDTIILRGYNTSDPDKLADENQWTKDWNYTPTRHGAYFKQRMTK